MPAITNYIDLIPLPTAKSYLRIDPSNAEFDEEITLLIDSACESIEGFTGHLLKPRDKAMQLSGCEYRVYEFPINSVVVPASEDDYCVKSYNNFSIYALNAYDGTLELNLGYTDTDLVPARLRRAVLELIRVNFYNSEMLENAGILPGYIKNDISDLKRFIL